MNSKSQQDWNEERRKLEWEAGAKSLRLLADRMEKDEIDKRAHWNIQLLLSEDLGKIFAYGKITDQRPPNPDERIAEEKLLKQSYADLDLRLFPGEEWLPTEPGVMSWYEAVRRVKNDPTLRLPHYSELIWVEQMVKQKPELQSKFKPLNVDNSGRVSQKDMTQIQSSPAGSLTTMNTTSPTSPKRLG